MMTQKDLLDALANDDTARLHKVLAATDNISKNSLEHSDVINDVDNPSTEQQTTLMRLCHLRVQGDCGALMRLALRRPSADINCCDRRGRTALMHACIAKRVDLVKLLSRRSDCDPNICDKEGRSALMYAIASSNEAVLKSLLHHCPDIDVAAVNKYGKFYM